MSQTSLVKQISENVPSVPDFPRFPPISRGSVTRPDDHLDGFQTDFSLLLGARFADPDHPAALGVGHAFIEDKFDNLTAPEVETSAHPETFFRGIEDEAREPLRLAVQIDDQASAPLRHHPRRAAALGDIKAEHSS